MTPIPQPLRHWWLPVLPVVWLWIALINHLRVEWSVNSQYTYGWAVPFLVGYLLWRRRDEIAEVWKQLSPPPMCGWLLGGAVLIAVAYAPVRLVEQANPDWRLMSWALALLTASFTLFLLGAIGGGRLLKATSYPVLFLLVSVPWPIPLVEQPLIQGLTRMDSAICAEIFNWVGVPVIPHGNVIELANGVVGINEACSGIRSFQATLMIALFLGDYYRLTTVARVGLVLAGFSFSIFFNLLRMLLLVGIASRQGVKAMNAWHDPAGVTILLGCFLGLWGLGSWLSARSKRTTAVPIFEDSKIQDSVASQVPGKLLKGVAFVLCLWLAMTEISVQGWYAWHAARLPAPQVWTLRWPEDAPGFQHREIPQETRQILRYDRGESVTWRSEGCQWSAVFLQWDPGRAAVHLAQNHTPEVCLTAAGHTLQSISPLVWINAKGFRLPFSVNQITDSPQPLFVFYCLWDDRTTDQGFDTRFLTLDNRLNPVRKGLRNPGQRSLEILVTGPATAADAQARVEQQLNALLVNGNNTR